jgi:hypothetical protein
MTCKGTVKGGVVVLEAGATLPEGETVVVHSLEDAQGPTLAERYRDVIGIAKGLPADASKNIDHYLHGSPKR